MENDSGNDLGNGFRVCSGNNSRNDFWGMVLELGQGMDQGMVWGMEMVLENGFGIDSENPLGVSSVCFTGLVYIL